MLTSSSASRLWLQYCLLLSCWISDDNRDNDDGDVVMMFSFSVSKQYNHKNLGKHFTNIFEDFHFFFLMLVGQFLWPNALQFLFRCFLLAGRILIN